MKNKWLIAVTAGRWQVQTIQQAKKMGINIIAIDSSPDAEGLAIADLAIVAKLTEFNRIINQIGGRNVAGVLSICSDAGMLLAGQLRDYYGVTTGPSFAVSQRLVNKAIQRKFWEKSNVNGPRWQVGNDIKQLLAISAQMPLPFMIKPVDSAGSRGVVKVESYDQDIESYLVKALSFSSTKEVIVEVFMPGKEYTVEAFTDKGQPQILAITEKKKISATQGLVAYQLSSANLSSKSEAKIKQLVTDAINALGYLDGACHAEIILMPDNTVGMVELAGRGGGFLVFERFVKLTSGFDIIRHTLNQALGEAFVPAMNKSQPCILHFFPNEEGTFIGVSGFTQANDIFGIEGASFIEPGTYLNHACCDGDRMGYVISYSNDMKQAESQLQQAIAFINFKVT